MTEYEAKQERRKARYLELAAAHRERAEERYNAYRQISDMIPMGQPILVGHHSEGRHRRDVGRIESNLSKSAEHREKAEYYENKAKNMSRAISSDDPGAIEKLQAKIDKAEAAQETYKAINKAIRLKDAAKGDALLTELGVRSDTIAKMREGDFAGRVGIPAYVLQNNNANIRRMKQRIDALQAQPTESKSEEHDGFKVVENADENRIQIIFPDKPDAETRSTLKSHGFRWSPTNGAWQRHLNNAGRYAVQQVANSL